MDVLKEVHRIALEYFPDAIVYASGNGWDLRGCANGSGYEMLDDDIIALNIPLLAFDTKEGYQKSYLEEYVDHPFFGTQKIKSPPIDDRFIALRNSPNLPEKSNVRYYKIASRFRKPGREQIQDLLSKTGLDAARKIILFPVPHGNFRVIDKLFSDYYNHLAGLFDSCSSMPVQFAVVSDNLIEAFNGCGNVIQIRNLPFHRFNLLLKSSDLILSDTLWSTSIFLAGCCGIPSVLLCNSRASVQEKSTNDEKIRWDSFVDELDLEAGQSSEIKRLVDRHKRYFKELCMVPALSSDISPIDHVRAYVHSSPGAEPDEVIFRLLDFLKAEKADDAGLTYFQKIDRHQSDTINEIFDSLSDAQRTALHAMNIQSLMDIDTGYDPFEEILDINGRNNGVVKASFRPGTLYPYKIFPYGMMDIANYLIERYHFGQCLTEIDVFNPVAFTTTIHDILFDESIKRELEKKYLEFQARYDKLPRPREILDELLK